MIPGRDFGPQACQHSQHHLHVAEPGNAAQFDRLLGQQRRRQDRQRRVFRAGHRHAASQRDRAIDSEAIHRSLAPWPAAGAQQAHSYTAWATITRAWPAKSLIVGSSCQHPPASNRARTGCSNIGLISIKSIPPAVSRCSGLGNEPLDDFGSLRSGDQSP